MTDDNDTVTADLPMPAAGPQMRMVSIALIEESLTNPRKYFDQHKLGELADSIRATGVNQPVLLRPLPGHRVPDTFGFRRQGAPLPEYELVAGARRFRASKIAKLEDIPAMIRELTDEQALEIQLIENLQREDMSPLEEAEGFRALMEHSGLTAKEVAAKIGKADQKNRGLSHVYARLKLLDLCHDARAAMIKGEIDASRAILIARVPDPKLQMKAVAEASRRNMRGDFATGVRDFSAWLEQNVMLRLESARFPILSADLVPGAGSCHECPRRTGAEPDLFADASSPDLCTDPKCFHAKGDAHSAQLREQAAKQGMRVIDGKEAKEVVSTYHLGYSLRGYSKLDAQRQDVAEGQEPATLRALLGGEGPQPVLIEHPQTKELIAAVPTDEAEAFLVQRGVLRSTERKIDVEAEVRVLKERSGHTQNRLGHAAVIKALQGAARAFVSPAKAIADAEFLRAWLHCTIRIIDNEDNVAIYELGDEAEDKAYDAIEELCFARVNRADDADVRRYALRVMLHDFDIITVDSARAMLSKAGAVLGVDVAAVEADAIAEEKEQLQQAIANVRAAAEKQEADRRAAAGKSQSATPLAAQAGKVREEGKGKKAGAKKQAAPREGSAATLSPAEAAAGISAALQAAEGAPDHGAAAGGAGKGSAGSLDAPAVADASQPVPAAAADSTAAPASGDAPRAAIAVGARVCVNANAKAVRPKWVGQEGDVVEALDASQWRVRFRKSGKKTDLVFEGDELDVLPAAEVEAYDIGDVVKVKPVVKGQLGKSRKAAGRVGFVVQTSSEGMLSVRMGPSGADVYALEAEDVDHYDAAPLIVIGCDVRTMHLGTIFPPQSWHWRIGTVGACNSDGWLVRFPDGTSHTFEPSELEVLA